MGKISETITGYPFNTGDELSSKSLNEITEALDGITSKQDIIPDLGTIRSGAALGATAVQPNALNNYYTKDVTDGKLATKQDALTAGDNIKIENNVISATDTKYVAGDFDIKDLSDTTGLRTKWDAKQDIIPDLGTIRSGAALGATAVQESGLQTTLSGYYTKNETNTLLKSKQDVIEDLETIRIQASKGANSIQQTELESILTDYYTSGVTDGKLATKQDALTAGSHIEISGNTISVVGLDSTNYISIEYSELVSLRDTSGLTPGMQYRLTDYECTVTNDTNARAINTGHFDIILVADDETTLNENVRFTYHEGDTYFVNTNLSAWEGKYCIDNDTDKFAWADSTNGKGVIYWLKDEWNNECPYDFKNIQFKRVENGVDNWYYTFTWVNESEVVQDASIVCYNIGYSSDKYYGVHDNIIKSLSSVEVGIENRTCLSVSLNNIVFISNSNGSNIFYGIFNNIFGVNNHTFTFKHNCSCNTFGDDCYDFIFGNNCYYNVFKQNCHNNIFGDFCITNTFANSCSNNEFAHNFQNNTIENSFVNNKLTNDFIKNCVFDNNVSNIKITGISTGNANYLQNINILSGTNNQTLTNLKTNQTYTQTCGFNSNNELINENILDTSNYPIITWTNNTATIKPNVYNIWNSGTYPTQLSLLTSNNTSIVNEYVIRFTIPSSVLNYSLSFNNVLKWVDNNIPTWEAGCTYEISIIDGYAVFLKYF